VVRRSLLGTRGSLAGRRRVVRRSLLGTRGRPRRLDARSSTPRQPETLSARSTRRKRSVEGTCRELRSTFRIG
jgi:hypothetical protein